VGKLQGKRKERDARKRVESSTRVLADTEENYKVRPPWLANSRTTNRSRPDGGVVGLWWCWGLGGSVRSKVLAASAALLDRN